MIIPSHSPIQSYTAPPISIQKLDESHALESVCFSIQGLKIHHQDEWRNLSVNLSLTELEGSDIRKIKNLVKDFLATYPNTDDFWEIMNVNLNAAIREEFPDFESLSTSLKLFPDASLSFPRESIVEYQKGEPAVKELFNYKREKYLICDQSFKFLDLEISWEMKGNPDRFDYPDYQWVNDALGAHFQKHPISYNDWSTIKPQLQQRLLDTYPKLASINIKITVNS